MKLRTSLRRLVLSTAAALLLLNTVAQPASAQRLRAPDREMTKSSDAIRSAFKEVVVDANKSTVKVRANGKDASLGTIVSADGYILTKASEISGKVTVVLRDGSDKPAKIVGVSDDNDLALLKIDATRLVPVQWADSKKSIVGQWVATPGMSDFPAAVGVMSVGKRKIPGKSGLLGVMLADGEGGAKVMQVIPESPAEKAGIHVDDIISRVNEKMVDSREALVGTIRSFAPGQEVKLIVQRAGKDLEFTAKLVAGIGPADRAEIMNQMGGPLSVRNANFPAVLQHDTVLTPIQCGGPLVTLEGKAIGINIARAGRVESFAIPSELVKELLPDLKSGKLAPKSQEKPTTKPAESKNEN